MLHQRHYTAEQANALLPEVRGTVRRLQDAKRVLQHLADLWGYDAVLKEVDPATDAVLAEHNASARPVFF